MSAGGLLLSIGAICAGASLGAVLRWGLGLRLNPLLPSLPLGTLASNLVGGLLIGLADAFFNFHSQVPVEWRLFAITGFLGGLTTFSTFSIEVVSLLGRQQYGWALAAAALHLAGSLALTALGWFAGGALFARAAGAQ